LLLNDIYAKVADGPISPPFALYRLMNVLWRRHVLTPILDSVIDELLSLFELQRNSYLAEKPDPDLVLIITSAVE